MHDKGGECWNRAIEHEDSRPFREDDKKMKLYVIKDSEELKGKTILSVCIEDNSIAILTDDGGIFAVRAVEGGYDCSISVADSDHIKHDIAYGGNVYSLLLSTNMVTQDDLNKFAKQQLKQKQEEREKRIKIAEQEEREEYLRLKAKYGDKK